MRAVAWGAGAPWALEHAPELIGAEDDFTAFEPKDDLMRKLWREHRSVRLARGRDVVRTLVAAILEQKVVGLEARRAWRRMTVGERTGSGRGGAAAAPIQGWSPIPLLRVPPGVERRRAEVIRAVCARASALEALADVPFDEARTKLLAFPGIGTWTTAEVMRLSFGDPTPSRSATTTCLTSSRGRSPANAVPMTSGCSSCWSRTSVSAAGPAHPRGESARPGGAWPSDGREIGRI